MKRRQVIGGLVALTGVVIAVIVIIVSDDVEIAVLEEPLDTLYAGPPKLRPPQNSIPTTAPNR